jgi:glyoxylase-like metal-dependent hydrolase (beta-lactamase superfamily II)
MSTIDAPRHPDCASVRRAVGTAIAAALVAWCIAAAEAAPLKVADGVYVLPGTGGEITRDNRGRIANVAFIVGPRGVAVIDTGISYREGEDVIAAVASVTERPIVLAIITHPGQEAVFGAAAFQARGIPVLAHRATAELIAARCETCLKNLREALGDDAMAGSRVAAPDRPIDEGGTIETIGRPLRLIAPGFTSAPGAIAVLDEATSTLLAGTLVSIHRLPDMRDADPAAWRQALGTIAALRCRHLIPAYGPIGTCGDVAAFASYFDALDRRVGALIQEGVGLAEVRNRCDLPQFAQWDQYETLHPQNANRTYLRLERLQFK